MNSIVILSWPSWVWKTTIWYKLISNHPNFFEKIVTTTSRSIRDWEKNWIDYYFISKNQFEKKIEQGDLIEYAQVHGNYYGSTYSELHRILEAWKIPMYIVDPQWAIYLKNSLSNDFLVTSFFILPPSIDELSNRVTNRWTESEEQIKIRMENANYELQTKNKFDYNIVNDDFDKAIEDFEKIFKNNLWFIK